MRRQCSPLPADLDQRLTQVQTLLAANRQVVFAYLFGGLTQGEPRPLSDVDIAVYLDKPDDSLAAQLDLIVAITKVLGSDALDLVVLNQAPLSLAGRIQQTGKLLVDKEPFQRRQYESLIRRQFADFQLLERAILERRFGLGG